MTTPEANLLAALQDLGITTDVLIEGLSRQDGDQAYEAISIMLMQGTHHFGVNSTPMQEFFPLWDAIRSRIDQGDLANALVLARKWQGQLNDAVAFFSAS